MTQYWKVLIVVVLLGCFSPAFAQDSRQADHEQLRALKTKAAAAFDKRDGNGIAALCTRDFAITTIDQTTLTSAAAINAHFKKLFASPDSIVADMKVSPDPEILTTFVDADNGYCFGKNHETYTMKDGRVVPMESRWTATVHRENGVWKIVTLHAGVDFLDNPVLSRANVGGRFLAFAGFGGGVVLASLCTWVLLRRRRG